MSYRNSCPNRPNQDEVKVAAISDEMRAPENQPDWQILAGAILIGLGAVLAIWAG
ncbi:MAG: hypothetical protein AAGC54_10070 [Cyanobacteria bacterium P01_F01_bin.4]